MTGTKADAMPEHASAVKKEMVRAIECWCSRRDGQPCASLRWQRQIIDHGEPVLGPDIQDTFVIEREPIPRCGAPGA